jgi:hypothetical protein
MRQLGSLFASTVLCLSAITSARGQDVNVTGTWELTSETPRGTVTSTLVFEQDGTALEGSMESQRGTVEFDGGTVEGNTIAFTIVRSGMGGRTFEMTYTGTVEGDKITGTMSTPRGEQPWTAKRVADSQSGGQCFCDPSSGISALSPAGRGDPPAA